MGNIPAIIAIILAAGSFYLQYRQIKSVSVPEVPWGQFSCWVVGLILGFVSFWMNLHITLVVPLSLAIAIFIFSILIVLTSRLPLTEPSVEEGLPYIDFTATDSEGKQFTLSSLEGKPVLLKFFRGHWCQYCYNELAAYNKFYEDYRKLGIEMVVLSADTREEAAKMKVKLGIKATVLSDENLDIIDKYRVRHERAMTTARKIVRPIAIPASVLISPDGLIRWIDVAENSRVRIDPLTVLIKSKTILERCEKTNKTRLVRSSEDLHAKGDQQ